MSATLSIERDDAQSGENEENETDEFLEEDDDECEEEGDDEEWQEEGECEEEDDEEEAVEIDGDVATNEDTETNAAAPSPVVVEPPCDVNNDRNPSQGRGEPSTALPLQHSVVQEASTPPPSVACVKDTVPTQHLTGGGVWTRYFGGNRLRIPERRQRAEEDEVKALLIRFARRPRT